MSAALIPAASLQPVLLAACGLAILIVVLGAAKRQARQLTGWLRRLAGSPVADDAPPDHAPPDETPWGDVPPDDAPWGDAPPNDVPWGDGADGSPPWPSTPPADPEVAPAPTGPRYAPDTFALVAEHVDHTQRLAFAEGRVERVLDALPMGSWYVQRFTLVAGHRIPFLVLGECGVFALWAIAGRPQWSDPAFVSDIASNVKRRLPDYPGPVNVGLCGVLQPEIKPRYWYRSGDGGGSWILGVSWLVPWMKHFGHDHGLNVKDIDRFRALATPDWSRPVAPVPPGIPIIEAHTPNAE